MNELLRRLLFLPPQASTEASSIDALHYLVIASTMLGAFGAFSMAAVFLVRYRAPSTGAIPLTPLTRPSHRFEVGMIAGILCLFIAFWIVGYRQYVDLEVPPPGGMRVYVTGKQWMWRFTHADGKSSLDVLTVPAGRPVTLVMTSRDVIHSFYVPAFRIKQDVVPGRYVTAWFEAKEPGRYDLYCAEYCGTSHSRMRGTILVLSPKDYDAWLDASPPAADETADMTTTGARVATRNACFACHTIDGQPHVGPTWSRLYGSTVTLQDGRRVVADEAYLTRSMMQPSADVVAGYRNVMPTFQGVLTEPDVAALVEYIKSLRDGPVAPAVPLPKVTGP